MINVFHVSQYGDERDGGIHSVLSGLYLSSVPCLQHHLSSSLSAISPTFNHKSTPDKPSSSIFHIHGLWFAATRYLSFNKPSEPFIISPHGMLDLHALSYSPLKKKASLLLFENRTINRATCLHAVSESELNLLRKRYPSKPVALIPNAVDLPMPETSLFPPSCLRALPADKKILLFFGRFHAKKGIAPLLEAWKLLSEVLGNLDWALVFCGFGDKKYLYDVIYNTFGELPSSIVILPPLFSSDRSALFYRSSAFILPSFSEGLPMTVFEAMSHRLPTITTPQCNLPSSFDSSATIPTNPDPLSIRNSLLQLFSMPHYSLNTLTSHALSLLKGNYLWPSISPQYYSLYKWALGGPPPSFLHL